jgi:hypothetical protein
MCDGVVVPVKECTRTVQQFECSVKMVAQWNHQGAIVREYSQMK